MLNIGHFIKQLLLTRGTICIPGFGTIETVHHPAEIKRSKSILVPPAKEIRFNENLIADDKVLSGYTQARANLSELKAKETLENFIKELKDSLDSQKSQNIKGIGVFKKDDAGKIQFEASPDLTMQVNSFGLPEIKIPNKPAEITTEKSISQPVHQKIIPVRKRRKLWIPVTIILVLAGIIVSLYYTGLLQSSVEILSRNFTKSKNIISNNSNKIIFGKRSVNEKDTLKERINKELNNITDREKALMYKEPVKKKNNKDSIIALQFKNQAANNASAPYYIIAGAYLIPNNAERQKSKLEEKGFKPFLLPPIRDFYMVSLGSYSSAEEAQIAVNRIHQQYNLPLWIMKI